MRIKGSTYPICWNILRLLKLHFDCELSWTIIKNFPIILKIACLSFWLCLEIESEKRKFILFILSSSLSRLYEIFIVFQIFIKKLFVIRRNYHIMAKKHRYFSCLGHFTNFSGKLLFKLLLLCKSQSWDVEVKFEFDTSIKSLFCFFFGKSFWYLSFLF